jgi:hypothetical protein
MADSEDAIPQIGSLVKDTALDGEKIPVVEILNKEIIVCGFKITASKYKDKGGGDGISTFNVPNGLLTSAPITKK